MHTVVTFPFENSNSETKYQVTKTCLQIHSIYSHIEAYLSYPITLQMEKERHSRKWQRKTEFRVPLSVFSQFAYMTSSSNY